MTSFVLNQNVPNLKHLYKTDVCINIKLSPKSTKELSLRGDRESKLGLAIFGAPPVHPVMHRYMYMCSRKSKAATSPLYAGMPWFRKPACPDLLLLCQKGSNTHT